MDKDVMKEILLLLFEIIKALGESLWKMVKRLFKFVWNRFFGVADISMHEEAEEQEWGVTGEDTWPGTQKISEASLDKSGEPQGETGKKEGLSVLVASEPQKGHEEKREEREVPGDGKFPRTPELPHTYGDNRIVLMVQDPTCLFTYWDINKGVMDKVLSSLGTLVHSAKIVLRVYDITDIIFTGNNAHKFFDIEIPGSARSWYIHVREPNRSFCVDIGFLTPNGTFRILSRSNTIMTSRTGISAVTHERWMDTEGIYREVHIPMGGGIPESLYERMQRDWQGIFKEGVSSPTSLKG